MVTFRIFTSHLSKHVKTIPSPRHYMRALQSSYRSPPTAQCKYRKYNEINTFYFRAKSQNNAVSIQPSRLSQYLNQGSLWGEVLEWAANHFHLTSEDENAELYLHVSYMLYGVVFKHHKRNLCSRFFLPHCKYIHISLSKKK